MDTEVGKPSTTKATNLLPITKCNNSPCNYKNKTASIEILKQNEV